MTCSASEGASLSVPRLPSSPILFDAVAASPTVHPPILEFLALAIASSSEHTPGLRACAEHPVGVGAGQAALVSVGAAAPGSSSAIQNAGNAPPGTSGLTASWRDLIRQGQALGTVAPHNWEKRIQSMSSPSMSAGLPPQAGASLGAWSAGAGGGIAGAVGSSIRGSAAGLQGIGGGSTLLGVGRTSPGDLTRQHDQGDNSGARVRGREGANVPPDAEVVEVRISAIKGQNHITIWLGVHADMTLLSTTFLYLVYKDDNPNLV